MENRQRYINVDTGVVIKRSQSLSICETQYCLKKKKIKLKFSKIKNNNAIVHVPFREAWVETSEAVLTGLFLYYSVLFWNCTMAYIILSFNIWKLYKDKINLKTTERMAYLQLLLFLNENSSKYSFIFLKISVFQYLKPFALTPA